MDADTALCGSEDATPGSSVCVCACSSWLGWAGRPPGRVLVRLNFHLAVLGALLACSAPSGKGLPRLWLLLGFSFSSFSPSPPLLRPRCVLLCVFSGPGCLGPWRLVAPRPPLFFSFSPSPYSVCPVVSCFSCFPASGALGLGLLLPPPPPPCPFFFVFCPPPPPPSCLWRFLLSGCLGCLRPPPPPFFLFFVFFPFFSFCRLCGAGRVCASWAVGCARVCLGGAVPVVALCALAGVLWCWLLGLAVLCCLPVGLGVVLRWCCPCLAAWLAALWFGAVCLGVPLPCVVLCCAVLSCGGVLSCSAVCLRRCLCLLFVSGRCACAVCVLSYHTYHIISIISYHTLSNKRVKTMY